MALLMVFQNAVNIQGIAVLFFLLTPHHPLLKGIGDPALRSGLLSTLTNQHIPMLVIIYYLLLAPSVILAPIYQSESQHAQLLVVVDMSVFFLFQDYWIDFFHRFNPFIE
jgi:hypothetical protein